MDPLDPSGLSKTERLEALKTSGLLRHDPQGRLDLLCETAASILRVPVALVNVLDDKYQTSIGQWPDDIVEGRKMPIDESGCKDVVLAKEPVVVENTLIHPTMCLREFVTVLGARAYLGVPVFYWGQVIGSFCVIDFKPRNWTTWDVAGLQGLARLSGLAVADDSA